MVSVEQPLGIFDALEDHAFSQPDQLKLIRRAQFLAGKYDDWELAQLGLLPDAFQ